MYKEIPVIFGRKYNEHSINIGMKPGLLDLYAEGNLIL
jgi:hypothetical protein